MSVNWSSRNPLPPFPKEIMRIEITVQPGRSGGDVLYHVRKMYVVVPKQIINKLRGLSPRGNYTGREIAACRIPYGRNLGFLDRSRYFSIK
jgi:hypothetical protein